MTRSDALHAAAARLAAAGVEDSRDEARRLLQHALDLTSAQMITGLSEAMTDQDAARFDAVLARRAAREPLSQILGRQGFWTLDLAVTADVLTPRADTETLVEAALAAFPEREAPLRVLDIATGSGAILLAVLDERPRATGVGTDLSAAALAVAAENARRCALADRAAFVRTCWADGLTGQFDLVISNPPYIASAVIETLDPEVRDHEPRLALDGGPDGLGPYPHLFAEARRLLAPGGLAVFEIGYDQGEAALALAREAGAFQAVLRRDLAGRNRAVLVRFDAQ